ncbi:hypothetical protein OAG71_00435 [bacterium]|nr:hypothetical protein [bacterium]
MRYFGMFWFVLLQAGLICSVFLSAAFIEIYKFVDPNVVGKPWTFYVMALIWIFTVYGIVWISTKAIVQGRLAYDGHVLFVRAGFGFFAIVNEKQFFPREIKTLDLSGRLSSTEERQLSYASYAMGPEVKSLAEMNFSITDQNGNHFKFVGFFLGVEFESAKPIFHAILDDNPEIEIN